MNRAEFKNANYPKILGHICDILDTSTNYVLIRPLTGGGIGQLMWVSKNDIGAITPRPDPEPKNVLQAILQGLRESV